MIEPQAMKVIDELEAFQRGQDDAWNIPRAEAMILHTLVVLGERRSLVEVGTSYGFSGLFLAAAAAQNNGMLHTFDVDPRKHEHAAANFAKAGLDEHVRLHTGDARELLQRLPDGVDFVFLDATKRETEAYWRLIEPKLAVRCAVAVDNTRTHPEALADFVRMLRTHGEFTCCDVPVGNGFELAVRP